MSDYYKLVDGKPVQCNLDEWVEWLKANPGAKRVEFTKISDEVNVSTVFLGIDHSFECYGQPVLWETMIFGGPSDQYQERYTNREDAIAGHKQACELAMESTK